MIIENMKLDSVSSLFHYDLWNRIYKILYQIGTYSQYYLPIFVVLLVWDLSNYFQKLLLGI